MPEEGSVLANALPSGSAAGGPRSGLPLRWRMLLVVLGINALFVALATFILHREQRREAERANHALVDESHYLLRGVIDPEGNLNTARILEWPSWPRFSDAVLLGHQIDRVGGRAIPRGVALNPLGTAQRSPSFEEQVIYDGIAEAIETGEPQEVLRGRAVPIVFAGTGVWGGFWYEVRSIEGAWELFLRTFLRPFLFLAALLSAGTFLALRRFVLDPVDKLADGASRVAGGELGVRIPSHTRRDELGALIDNFNTMTAEVQGFSARLEHEVAEATAQARAAEAAAMTQRRLAATGELAAGIAHEINNPLGGLLNAVDVLGRDAVPEPKRAQYLQLLNSGLRRIQRTVEKLLRFTPRSTQAMDLAPIAPLLDALDLVRHRAKEGGVELWLGSRAVLGTENAELRQDYEHLPQVCGEPTELGQLVLNLLVNALDAVEDKWNSPALDLGAAGREGPRVQVQLSSESNFIAVRVSDNGAGVAEAELDRLPDLFYTTKDVGRGTGLGLAIVFKVTHQMGGEVSLESEEGHSFTVTVRWPISRQGSDKAPGQASAGREQRSDSKS